ncbi:MupA/Atu3671 family FMN-dependent luciferase-like monooxygenase [Streptomyces boncukensis]|uniref:LLM class flavin-dependent oxidoreductase n=1 Tax=Streptomyces boncukensis TaxID=2711219 RepID=A0A6G4X5H5_9ACTN|nr:MupA/Atu3671 family FMN-dependent luciferase-like monooxygenase [Streptomyces boncukensis]NGO72120.1 LLM class flavin-dependent oxidoreductase [Streptomyces boncukensis]
MEFSVYFFSANDRYDFGSRYRFILDVARYVDRHGFRAMWTPERHFQEFGGSFPNPSVLSAALAVATERIDLRAGSVVLPHHHPVRVVEEWALVDQLSRGRTGLCVATGWHSGDFVFYPGHYADRREYAFGHIETLRALWRGDTVGFPGPGGEPVDVRTYPRPRQAELPLWIVHSSNPRTWVAAGELGTGVLSLLDSWERLEQNIAAYREARRGAGLDPAGGTVTVGLHTFLGEDEDQVRALVEEPVKNYLASFLTQKSNDSRTEGTGQTASDSERDTLARVMADDYYRRRSLLGTQVKCADVVRRLADIGVDEIACLVDFGLPFDTVLGALPRLNELRQEFAPAAAAPSGSAGAPSMAWYYER